MTNQTQFVIDKIAEGMTEREIREQYDIPEENITEALELYAKGMCGEWDAGAKL